MTGNAPRDQEPDVMGGPEPDEQQTEVMGGTDPDQHTDIMDKPDPGQNHPAQLPARRNHAPFAASREPNLTG